MSKNDLHVRCPIIGTLNGYFTSLSALDVTWHEFYYSATTRTGALGRVSNHNVLWEMKDSQVFFGKRTNEIQGSTMQPLKTIKPFELT